MKNISNGHENSDNYDIDEVDCEGFSIPTMEERVKKAMAVSHQFCVLSETGRGGQTTMEEKVVKCRSCGIQVTPENFGGNEYWDNYCKSCWVNAKKWIGRSWGGEVDDREYSD